ncbi:MAG TPA: hypothetical protein VNQ90_15730 [Chthoniobacteraceae bacterium]|nr:hypothetical protein [Chthoniobacteraceae bacterium]
MIFKYRRLPAAFTVVELLITITLMAVLAYLCLAVSIKVAAQGKLAKSTRHLEMIGTALNLYLTDRNGRLPEAAGFASSPGLPGVRLYWFDALAYYLEGPDYLAQRRDRQAPRPEWQTCPARPLLPPKKDPARGQGISVGYGWNHKYFGYTPTNTEGTSGYGSRITEVPYPASTIIIGTNAEKQKNGVPMSADAAANANLYHANLSERFDGAGLYLFLDGHIQRMTPAQVQVNGDYLLKKKK